MDLSMLLSQAQLSYSKSNFYKNPKSNKKKNNQAIFVQIFQQNLQLITLFLTQKQSRNLRLICRGVGYLFIIKDLWMGMKIQVADKKLQDMDDYDFVQQEPKQISKEDKKIRIHSLKKNMAFSISKKPQQKRQASNIKQKNISMTIIDNQLNPLRRTQIGFKRLLKAPNPKISNLTSTKNIKQKQKSSSLLNQIDQCLPIQRLSQLLQIPSAYSIDDLLINPKDQWVKNMHRANNLITVVKKWNMFFERIFKYLGRDEDELLGLMKKVIKVDGCLLNYKTMFQEQPHHTILNIIQQSAPKNALIQQQLNKIGKQFIQNHSKLTQLINTRQTQQIITQLHECYQKLCLINKKTLSPSVWAQSISVIQQSFNQINSVIQSSTSQKFKQSIKKSISNIFKGLIEEQLQKDIVFQNLQENQKQGKVSNLRKISLKFIIQNSEFCQLVFQILYNFYGKLSTEASNNKQSPQSNKTTGKVLGSVTSLVKQNENVFSKKLKITQKTASSFQNSNNKLALITSKLSSTYQKPKIQAFRLQKTLFGILWNISKYFDKLQKQLSVKQKKKKQQAKVHLIKNFIQKQSFSYKHDILLIHSQSQQQQFQKSLTKLQQYYKQFKKKIENLKQQMNKGDN